MQAPLGIMGTPGMSLFGLIIIGGLAGWIAGMIMGSSHRLFTNIIVGIVGSWLGSQLAEMGHVAVRGSLGHFIAALIGSCLVLFIWQKLRNSRAA